MFGSDMPTWRQILGIKKKIRNNYWDDQCIWTSGSGVSIKIILEKYREHFSKEVIEFWIPDYFCVETEAIFKAEFVKIIYYPITEDLEPNWIMLKTMSKEKKPDIFLFVHYFGVFRDINKAWDFCNQNNSVLIEDCAHVLYNSGKFGSKADFTIFSPHKILPVYDGAIIYYNSQKEEIKKIGDELKERLNGKSVNPMEYIWRAKKAIQKLIRYRKNTHFKISVHKETIKELSKKNVNISKWSYSVLKEFSYEKIKSIALRRNMNLKIMNYIVTQICDEIIPIISECTFCPYIAVYSLEKIKDKQKVVSNLEKRGILVTFWPMLSSIIDVNSVAAKLSENYIFIPIHQGLNPQKILRKYSVYKNKSCQDISVHLIKNCQEIKKMWNTLFVEKANIPQDWIYGDVKCEVEENIIKRFGVYNSKFECVGALQILIKKKWGIPIMARINRGPILSPEFNTVENIVEIMKQVKKNLRMPIPYFWAPNISFSPQNMDVLIQNKWICWKDYGYPSGWICLEKDEEELRKQLDSKWRNQLKMAEKTNIKVLNDNGMYKKLLKIYLRDQEVKGYIGIPKKILIRLFEDKETPLTVYYVLNDTGEPMAFDIIYKQTYCAHYLVGWNSNEGRKNNLNNLLLFYALIDLKKKGIKTFDMGGIDYIHTEDIAKFKDGMKPSNYQLVGEFFNWI